jgi:non-canonical (house-cleaning) NTP pyrophosphatase
MTGKKPSGVTRQPKPDATKQTARERAERERRENPRCTEAPKAGKGFIIDGVRKP